MKLSCALLMFPPRPGSGGRVRVLRLLRHLERLPRPGPGDRGQWHQWGSDAQPDQDQLRQVRAAQRLGGRGGGGGGRVRGAPRQHLLRPGDHAVRQVYPGTCSLTSLYTEHSDSANALNYCSFVAIVTLYQGIGIIMMKIHEIEHFT